jgi:hypothetical protein
MRGNSRFSVANYSTKMLLSLMKLFKLLHLIHIAATTTGVTEKAFSLQQELPKQQQLVLFPLVVAALLSPRWCLWFYRAPVNRAEQIKSATKCHSPWKSFISLDNSTREAKGTDKKRLPHCVLPDPLLRKDDKSPAMLQPGTRSHFCGKRFFRYHERCIHLAASTVLGSQLSSLC